MGWHLNAAALHDQIWVAAITLAVITVINIYSVKLVSIINNTGVFFEIVGMVIFAIIMLIVHRHQPVSVVTNSGGIHVTFGAFFLAMFMSLFVIYGFDTASTLAEETNDPRRNAPKAVLSSVAGAFVIGGIFLLATLMAIPNLAAAIKSSFGPAQIIEANFSKNWAIVYLLVVSAAILVCCMCIMAATIRLCFGMARDNRLPGSRHLAKVHPRLHTPILSCLVVAVIAAIPMFKYAGAGIVAISATALIYLSYFLGNVAIMWARVKNGWPKVAAPFKLGRWGMVVNVLALAYGGAMLVNFGWFGTNRASSNPKPNQTAGPPQLGVEVPQRHPDPLRRARLHPHRRGAVLLHLGDQEATAGAPAGGVGPLRDPAGVAASRRCRACLTSVPVESSRGVSEARRRSSRRPCGYGRRETDRGEFDRARRPRRRPRARRAGAAPRGTSRSWAARRSARTGCRLSTARRGPASKRVAEELVERALERLFKQGGEALPGKARLLEHEGEAVGQAQARHLDHRCSRIKLEGGGNLGQGVLALGVQEHRAGHQAVAAGLIGESREVTEIAFDGRLGHEGSALAPGHTADEAPSLQVGEGLAQRQPVDPEPGGELALGGKAVAAVEVSARHRTLDGRRDLGVQRASRRGPASPAAQGREPGAPLAPTDAIGTPLPPAAVSVSLPSGAHAARASRGAPGRSTGWRVMSERARAVVIGGGVGGCSILYWLARAWAVTDSVLLSAPAAHERFHVPLGRSRRAAAGVAPA